MAAVPIIAEGAALTIEPGLELTHTRIVKRPNVAALHAFHEMSPVGSLKWDLSDGEALEVYFHPSLA